MKKKKTPRQANNQLITGGVHSYTKHGNITVQADNSTEKGIDILLANVAPGAHHNSGKVYEKPKCHAGTREAVLKEIMNWVRDPTCSYPILWEHGPAGSGKSSIARSVADMCKKDGLLAADFFFFRTDNGLNSSERLIPTLTYQIMLAVPSLRNAIGVAILHDPLIFSSSLESQLRTLLVQPIVDVFPTGMTSSARLVILDGLDECGDRRAQQEIISTLTYALTNLSLPFRFMIASRPEQSIREAFKRESTNSLTRQLVLDNKYNPDADIRLFLNARFSDIKATHPARNHLPSLWPSEDKITFLVQKSSGQFIYASTVMKFIESPHCLPYNMLDIVLKLKLRLEGNSPYAELDALYTHIFESVHDFEKVWQIFACLIYSKIDSSEEPEVEGRQFELTPSNIERFLGFRPGQLQVVLVDLHSVLHIPEDNSGSDAIRLLHASLPDFLCDEERSGKFFVEKRKAHAFLAQRCGSVLIPGNFSFIEYSEYLIHGFVKHCSQAVLTQELLDFLQGFPFITWLDLRLSRRVVYRHYEGIVRHKFSVDIFDTDVQCLLKWLNGQPPDGQLYSQYINNFDEWLRLKLTRISIIPASPYLFASLALNNNVHDWDKLHDLIQLRSTTDPYHYGPLREAALLHGQAGNPYSEDRLPGANALDLPVYHFFWDRTRAKEFYPKKSWFIDLATLTIGPSWAHYNNGPIWIMLQRTIVHFPMDRDIYKLLLAKYPQPESMLFLKDTDDPEYRKAYMSTKQFMKDYKSTHGAEALRVLQEIDNERNNSRPGKAKKRISKISNVISKLKFVWRNRNE